MAIVMCDYKFIDRDADVAILRRPFLFDGVNFAAVESSAAFYAGLFQELSTASLVEYKLSFVVETGLEAGDASAHSDVARKLCIVVSLANEDRGLLIIPSARDDLFVADASGMIDYVANANDSALIALESELLGVVDDLGVAFDGIVIAGLMI